MVKSNMTARERVAKARINLLTKTEFDSCLQERLSVFWESGYEVGSEGGK